MTGAEDVFDRLGQSTFRRRFRLGPREAAYLAAKGEAEVLRHAADFIALRLAPAQPINDGKQTPMRGHPVFVAQHATATCCRGCLARWHKLPSGRALSAEEQSYVVEVIARWLRTQPRDAITPADPQLDFNAIWQKPKAQTQSDVHEPVRPTRRS